MAKKPIVIPAVEDEGSYVLFTLPDGSELRVLRMDVLDEDAADDLHDSIEALNSEFEFGSVAADVAAMKPDDELFWVPLRDNTKAKLMELGVCIERVLRENQRVDKITVPDEDVVAEFEPYLDFKPKPPRKRGRELALVMLKHVVTEDEYSKLENLRLFQLEHIASEWRKHSKVSLGE